MLLISKDNYKIDMEFIWPEIYQIWACNGIVNTLKKPFSVDSRDESNSRSANDSIDNTPVEREKSPLGESSPGRFRA
jgi:hypothetical protein